MIQFTFCLFYIVSKYINSGVTIYVVGPSRNFSLLHPPLHEISVLAPYSPNCPKETKTRVIHRAQVERVVQECVKNINKCWDGALTKGSRTEKRGHMTLPLKGRRRRNHRIGFSPGVLLLKPITPKPHTSLGYLYATAYNTVNDSYLIYANETLGYI